MLLAVMRIIRSHQCVDIDVYTQRHIQYCVSSSAPMALNAAHDDQGDAHDDREHDHDGLGGEARDRSKRVTVTTNIISVDGGGLETGQAGAGLSRSILLRPIEVDGRQFVVLPKKMPLLSKFLNGNYAMYHYLVRKRNEQVDAVVNGGAARAVGAAKKLKRDFGEELPTVASIVVHDVVIDVLTTQQSTASLGFEAVEANFELLLTDPPAAPTRTIEPVVDTREENVVWHASRKRLVVAYFCGVTQRWRRKYSPVIDVANAFGEAAFRQVVDEHASALQSFYNEYHFELPGVDVDAIADADDDER
jgi:hypothetical protein